MVLSVTQLKNQVVAENRQFLFFDIVVTEVISGKEAVNILFFRITIFNVKEFQFSCKTNNINLIFPLGHF